MIHLDHLQDAYYWIWWEQSDGSGVTGDVIARDECGDILLPPYGGRWRVLEEASSRDEAERIAATWAAQEGE